MIAAAPKYSIYATLSADEQKAVRANPDRLLEMIIARQKDPQAPLADLETEHALQEWMDISRAKAEHNKALSPLQQLHSKRLTETLAKTLAPKIKMQAFKAIYRIQMVKNFFDLLSVLVDALEQPVDQNGRTPNDLLQKFEKNLADVVKQAFEGGAIEKRLVDEQKGLATLLLELDSIHKNTGGRAGRPLTWNDRVSFKFLGGLAHPSTQSLAELAFQGQDFLYPRGENAQTERIIGGVSDDKIKDRIRSRMLSSRSN